ncbi:hypothetical protein P9112_006156 [Eukaryota sp. TZLM1-RC]
MLYPIHSLVFTFLLLVTHSVTFQSNTELLICQCDLTVDYCDPLCCCDPDCSENQVDLFGDKCLPEAPELPSVEVCTDSTLHSTHLPSTTSSTSPLCVKYIHSELAGLFYPPPPSLSTSDASDYISTHSTSWPTAPQPPPLPSSYEPLSYLHTPDGLASFPGPSSTSSCEWNHLGFLKNVDSECVVESLSESVCNQLSSMFISQGVEVLSTPISETIPISYSINHIKDDDVTNLVDSFVDGNICRNVVVSSSFYLKHDDNGELIEGLLDFIIDDVALGSNLMVNSFLFFDSRDISEFISPSLKYKGGNPGYVEDRFIPVGFVNDTIVVRNDDLPFLPSISCFNDSNYISFLQNSENSCSFFISLDEFSCSSMRSIAFDLLKGELSSESVIAKYGNSSLNQDDWIAINDVDMSVPELSEDTGYCSSVPRAVHIDILYTKSGSIINPQYSIIHVRRRLETFDWFPRCSDPITCADGFYLTVKSVVQFIEYTSEAEEYIPPVPSFLPSFSMDWFHPFYREEGNFEVTVALTLVLFVFVVLLML